MISIILWIGIVALAYAVVDLNCMFIYAYKHRYDEYRYKLPHLWYLGIIVTLICYVVVFFMIGLLW